MAGLTRKTRGRTFLAGKVIFNFGQSTIDCVVRQLADDAATIELVSGVGVPERFQLSIAGEAEPLPCKLVWQSEKQVGVSFDAHKSAGAAIDAEEASAA